MTKNYKILSKFIKDMSSETENIETYLFVKDYISKYQLNIDITSKALKNKLIEINTTFKFEDKEENKNKSYFEIVFATIIKVNDTINEKKELEKIISEVLSKNQDKLTQYKSGKVKLFGYFVGEVMKVSKGKANPQLVNEILKMKLK